MRTFQRTHTKIDEFFKQFPSKIINKSFKLQKNQKSFLTILILKKDAHDIFLIFNTPKIEFNMLTTVQSTEIIEIDIKKLHPLRK